MTANKRKKVIKYRAHTTHGGGHRKKRRGAGHRGGRGRAGSGKRGKSKKQSYAKLGKHGFVPRSKTKKIKTLNLSRLNNLIQNKKITEKKGIIDLASFGYQKLLSTGNIKQKLKIKVNQFSKQAEEKIKAAGGSIVPGKEKKEVKPEE